jgi:DNA adenine methylase
MRLFDMTQPPFTYFGRKYKVADQVWELFGTTPKMYVEPFFGSGAVLLKRPNELNDIITRINDLDGLVVNFWRALKADPQSIAEWGTRPVSEADQHACHITCTNQRHEIVSKLCGDPEWYDLKLAQYWVYGINTWVGGGWCSGDGPWNVNEYGEMAKTCDGVRAQKTDAGARGILSNGGVRAKKTDAGARGILSNTTTEETPNQYIGKLARNIEWLGKLSHQLMRTTICNGSWERVLTESYLDYGKKEVAIFLDPPYDPQLTSRKEKIYGSVSDIKNTISSDVREWCKNVKHENYKVILCGYDCEHDELLDIGWTKLPWTKKASLGMKCKENQKTEYLWVNFKNGK